MLTSLNKRLSQCSLEMSHTQMKKGHCVQFLKQVGYAIVVQVESSNDSPAFILTMFYNLDTALNCSGMMEQTFVFPLLFRLSVCKAALLISSSFTLFLSLSPSLSLSLSLCLSLSFSLVLSLSLPLSLPVCVSLSLSVSVSLSLSVSFSFSFSFSLSFSLSLSLLISSLILSNLLSKSKCTGLVAFHH